MLHKSGKGAAVHATPQLGKATSRIAVQARQPSSEFSVKSVDFPTGQGTVSASCAGPSISMGMVPLQRSQQRTARGGGRGGKGGGREIFPTDIPQLSHSWLGPVGTGAVSTA